MSAIVVYSKQPDPFHPTILTFTSIYVVSPPVRNQPQLAGRFHRLWKQCAGGAGSETKGVIKCKDGSGEALAYFTFIFSLTSAKKRRLL
jgi:hypothetical protein